jgi:hypothetical protein
MQAPPQKPCRRASNRLIVKLHPDIISAMDDGAHGLRWARPAGLPNAAVYSILDGTDPEQKAKEVAKLPGAHRQDRNPTLQVLRR